MARLLHDVLFRRWERGDDAFSTRAVARLCRVSEKTAREWRDGEKHVPWSLARVLPGDVVEEINEGNRAASMGAKNERWALGLMRRGLTWLEEHGMRGVDRYETMSALVDIHARTGAAIAKIATEGK